MTSAAKSLSASSTAPAGLSASARRLIAEDTRRIVITGASGWIGRATLALLKDTLGPEFQERVRCFGSSRRTLQIDQGVEVEQFALDELSDMDQRPTLLLHLAFLTKDRVGSMDDAAYRAANRSLSASVRDALEPIGVDRLFIASSGAAAFADDLSAAADLRLYGGLKRDDENMFAAWAEQAPQQRRVAIARIFSLSGPYINKHQTYALASFILDALAERPVRVEAPIRVVRSYVAIREVVSLLFAILLREGGEPVVRFDTGGTAMELGDVASTVSTVLGGGGVDRAMIGEGRENHYAGNDAHYRALLSAYNIEPVGFDAQIVETAAYLSTTS